MKGAQIGGTEAGNNWVGYIIDQAPGPMLVVQPTVEMAKDDEQLLKAWTNTTLGMTWEEKGDAPP